jgi:hypothetical protein
MGKAQAPELSSAKTVIGPQKNATRSSEFHDYGTEHKVVQCTYIGVTQAPETLECILSRPSWLWGCEMGANKAGVAGGNKAIESLLSGDLLSPQDGKPSKSLPGMDILHLTLERGLRLRQSTLWMFVYIFWMHTFKEDSCAAMMRMLIGRM